jgi:hypothetical protein
MVVARCKRDSVFGVRRSFGGLPARPAVALRAIPRKQRRQFFYFIRSGRAEIMLFTEVIAEVKESPPPAELDVEPAVSCVFSCCYFLGR